MKITEYMKNNILYLDGAVGTVLQDSGLKPFESPEEWNFSHPDIVSGISKAYFDAGSNVVCTNTFSANALKYGDKELDNIISSALANAKRGRELSTGAQKKFIALDIGPLGKLLKPFGEIDFEHAVSLFAKAVKAGVQNGAELIMIETMNDSYETKAALLAAKENSSLPVFVSNAYGEDGKLLTGAPPEAMACLIEGMGADAVGVNCSFGPEQSLAIAEKLIKNTYLPVIMKPNAGMPRIIGNKTVYDLSPDSFAAIMYEAVKAGVDIVGGCCGTNPLFIKKLVKKTTGLKPVNKNYKRQTIVSSYARFAAFGKIPLIIGERINPTGKKRFKQALLENDIDYILSEGLKQQKNGANILDVNVGLPDTDEAAVLKNVIERLQAVCDLPLQLDSSDPCALEKAMRIYNGKPLINSVNGKKEVMRAVFPLIKKYGGAVIALTLDENGIPESASGRVGIALKIIEEAKKYNIDKSDIIFDPLVMSVGTKPENAEITLKSLKEISRATGCPTLLGISNISFGLPAREKLNSAFFLLALNEGLCAAIIDPCSGEMLNAFYSYCALKNIDVNFEKYIKYAHTGERKNEAEAELTDNGEKLFEAVFGGRKERAKELTRILLESEPPLDIINKYIIPALDKTGTEFEKKVFYLPQLLTSAEAASEAFSVIKSFSTNFVSELKCPVVIATVKGDIHDIGKNIVRLLLENYGFKVIDLGKDVAPDDIVAAVMKHKAPLAGLSALMTTTLPAMEETVSKLKLTAPFCRVIVGGAVVSKEYAESINADKYAADAMETVRYCAEIYNKL